MTHMPKRPVGRPPKPVEMPEVPEQDRPDPDLAWYVVIAKPGAGQEAVKNLRKAGYAAWCPLCLVEKHHAGLRKIALEPLFPPYLFAGIDTHQAASPVLSAIGVADFLRSDTKLPQRIGADALTTLWDRIAEEGGAVKLARVTKGPWAKRGDLLQVTSGPFANFTGICSYSKGERIKILLDILGSQREISLPSNQVIRAG